MSGNFVQRGSPAAVNRFSRAKAALRIGADLVLSLPFPYCAASAEYFAGAGVYIADSLSAAFPNDSHFLAFGSECGDIAPLTLCAKRMADDDFRRSLYSGSHEYHTAKGIQQFYFETFGDDTAKLLSSPNNTLAIEYLRAIRILSSDLTPITIKRFGSEHDGQELKILPSASMVREKLYENNISDALGLLPENIREIISESISKFGVSHENNYGDTVLGAIRMMKKEEASAFAECSGGVAEKLIASAQKASSYSEMISLSSCRQYTNARLRRAALFAYLGITKKDISSPPTFTQLLAANKRGTDALRGFSKNSRIEILTKAANHTKMTPEASKMYALEARSELLYTLSYMPHLPSDVFLKISPYILKDEISIKGA